MSVMNRDGSKGDMDDLYGCHVPKAGPGIREDLDLIDDALARRTKIPANGRRWIAKRAMDTLRDDQQDLERYDRAALMLHRLDQISLKADEFVLKAKLVEKAGVQSWAAWLAEDDPEPDALEALTEGHNTSYVPTDPTPPSTISLRTDVQDESTPSGPAGLEGYGSRVLAQYAAYLKGDAARAEASAEVDWDERFDAAPDHAAKMDVVARLRRAAGDGDETASSYLRGGGKRHAGGLRHYLEASGDLAIRGR